MRLKAAIEHARALVGRLHAAVTAGDVAAEADLLEELRARLLSLRGVDPAASSENSVDSADFVDSADYEALLEAYGRALVIALHGVKARGDLAACIDLLGDLEELHAVRLDSPTVRAWRAKGLVDALHVARSADDLAQRDVWLVELRRLAAGADEAPVREEMAWGLANTLYQMAGEPTASARRGVLLAELEELAAEHPGQVMLQAIALVARISVHPTERDALLERLGQLAAEHPDEQMLVALARQHGA